MNEKAIRELASDLGELFPIPDPAAHGYLAVREAMAQHVDHCVMDHPELERLVGGDCDAMRSNHRHHVEFMGSVFALNAPELLVRLLPWVYRTYRAHGFDVDYFPVELDAWREAVGLYVDDAEPIQAVYTWMIDHHDRVAELSREPDLGLLYEPMDLSREGEATLGLLLRGDTGEFLDSVQQRVETVDDLRDFYCETIQPVMYRVGELWESDQISVAQEHLVTATVSRGMSLLCSRLQCSAPARGKAIVACVSHEFHELGARMVADLLEMDGWDVMFMGANLPEGDLVRFVSRLKPDLVCLSVTVPMNLLQVRQMVQALREQLTPAPRIMVGGQALADGGNLCESLGADACPGTAAGAADMARKWWEEARVS